MKKILFLLICIITINTTQAQTQTLHVQTSAGSNVTGATVELVGQNITAITNTEGNATLNIKKGTYLTKISAPDYDTYSEKVTYTDKIVKIIINKTNDIPTLVLDDESLNDNETGAVSSLLTSSRDIFNNVAGFNWGNMRFSVRGYDRTSTDMMINGAHVNDLERGQVRFSDWGGLNDFFRGKDNSIGIEQFDMGFGELNGMQTIDARAGKQRKGIRASYALTNRGTYNNRLMVAYNSGLSAKKWAYSIGGSRRWAVEGAIPGTYSDMYSYFFGVEKQFNKQSLALTVFGNKSMRALSGPHTKEQYQLADNNLYNSNWGMQEGKIRNSAINKTHSPMAILTHEWKPSSKTSLITALMAQKGSSSRTRFVGFSTNDARPDFYRFLPSYYLGKNDTNTAMLLENFIINNRETAMQINWQGIYEGNQIQADTTVNGVTGKLSQQVLAADHSDPTRISFNTNFSHAISSTLSLNAGLKFQRDQLHKYFKMEDLLGGDFFVDVDPFALDRNRANPNAYQNNLNTINNIVKVGDVFTQNYKLNISSTAFFAQLSGITNRIDYFVAAEIERNTYQREGLFKDGMYPNSSLGKSEKKSVIAPSVKAGVTYKINGRNYAVLNAGMLSDAPLIDNVMISDAVRNDFVSNIKAQKSKTIDASYYYRSPYFKSRATVYYTSTKDAATTKNFWDPDVNNNVNMNLSGIATENKGIELGAEGKVYKGLSAQAAIAYGQHTYTSRPTATTTVDNDPTVNVSETIYMKGFNLATGPQEAYNVGLRYNSPKFWFLNLNANYYRRAWVDINPVRRTDRAVDNVTEAKFDQIINQEKLSDVFMMDFFGGYSWKLDKTFKSMKKPYYLNFNLGINNLLNNKNIVQSGFEQLRYDFTNRNPEAFPRRYFYAQGITYYVSMVLRF
jgi:hypothetical protein